MDIYNISVLVANTFFESSQNVAYFQLVRVIIPLEGSDPEEMSVMVDPPFMSSDKRDVEFHQQSQESEQPDTQYWIVEGASRTGRVIHVYTEILYLNIFNSYKRMKW